MKKVIILYFVLSAVLSFSLFADIEDTYRQQIPSEYYSRSEKSGTTQLFKYKSAGSERSAIVYLPYGYNENDQETRYPVLFLQHGGGGTATTYIGPAGAPNQLIWIVDNAIAAGEIEPLIIVCGNDTGTFYLELRKFLLPAIDNSFNTKATRESRAFGGFSMGSVATWNVFLHDLDLIPNYIPMCGDCWACGQTGGKNFPEQTAIVLSKAAEIEKYSDYKIFAATGTGDTAYPNMVPQINAMKELEEFQYTTKDFSDGNFIFYVVKGYVHSYNHTYEYLYNALKLFFPK